MCTINKERLRSKYILIAAVVASIVAFGQEPIYENAEQAKVIIDSLKASKEGSFQLTIPSNTAQGELTLADICPDKKSSDIELAIFDGNDWRRFISVIDRNSALHWHDAFTYANLDDYPLKAGMTIAYKLPEGVSYLSCLKIIQQPLCGPLTALKLSISEVKARNKLLMSVSMADNDSGVTNTMPTKLQVRFPNGDTIEAEYSKSTGQIMVQGGGIIDETYGVDFTLEIDPAIKDGSGWNNMTIATFILDEQARKKGIALNDIYDAIANRTIDEHERRQDALSIFKPTKREWVAAILGVLLSLLLTTVVAFLKKIPFTVSVTRKKKQNGQSHKKTKKK